MDLIKNEMDSEFSAIGFRNQRKVVKVLPQVKVKSDKRIDASRHAYASGKRISKTGRTYWETRSNRTDSKGSNL